MQFIKARSFYNCKIKYMENARKDPLSFFRREGGFELMPITK
jgi:hypothetical protein